MKKLTTREKVFLGIGILAIVIIFAYLLVWPMFQKNRTNSRTNIQEMQNKLNSLGKLGSMASTLGELEDRMKTQVGYKEAAFRRGIADSMIIKYVSQAASSAGINEIDQLEPKPDVSKRTAADTKANQVALVSVIDQLYLVDVLEQLKKPNNPGEDPPNNLDNKDNSENDVNEKSSTQLSTRKVLFPLISKDMPEKARQAMVKSIEERQGKNPGLTELDNILANSGLIDDKEKERLRNRLKTYSDRVKESKTEMQKIVNDLGIIQGTNKREKIERFTVKVIFKSRIDQLVRFLYNVQNSARWLKIDSMNVNVADKKQNILSVEISMTANILYE